MKLTAPKGFKSSLPAYNNGHWSFPEQMGKGAGFVYVIRDNVLERFYLGKKHFTTPSGIQTNWRLYMSSSPLLEQMFEERPKDEFDFFCLEQYKSRGTIGYAETWSLCHVQAPTTNVWYNRRVEKVTWNVKEPISERHVERLKAIIRMENPDA